MLQILLMIANLTIQTRSLRIDGLALGEATVVRLDKENVAYAKRAPEAFRSQAGQPIKVTEREPDFKLPPYGIARIDQNQ